ncbi:MAG: tetratricopeptide repeat protein, partial [Planctomycetota bacterium]
LERWRGHEDAIWCQMELVFGRIRQWDMDGAEAELGVLLSEFADDKRLSEAVHEIVEEYRNTGAHEEGRELFGYLLENWYGGEETMLELQVGIALQSIKLGELDKAESATRKLIADYNDNPKIGKALFQIAEQQYYAHKLHVAIKLWLLVRSDYWDCEFENKQEVSFMVGNSYQLLDDHNRAIHYYKESVQEYPQGRMASRACDETGMIFFSHKKDYDQAVEWLHKALELRQKPREFGERTLFNLVVAYTQKLKDYEKGIAAARQYMQEYPHRAGLWGVMKNLASCHEELGNIAEAIAVLQQAYEIRTDEGLRSYITEKIAELEQRGAQ